MLIRTFGVFAALLASIPMPLAAQAVTPAEQAQIDALVAKEMQRTETPSVSIALVRDGKTVLTKAYGKASETLRATPDLPYQIASNSKQFTAMALLLLEDDGKLSLDDPVAKYLPGITGGETIRLRQLLSHTSGIQDFWPQDYSFAAMSKPARPQDIVDRWARQPLDYAPGTKWQYSNTGYVVAGMIAEKVSGQPLVDFLRQRIFAPLSMTSVIDQDLARGPRFPVGYGRAALGPVRAEPFPAAGWLYAAGELSMTPADLAKWDIARIDRALVPADDWTSQEAPVFLPDGTDTHYGLGVDVDEENGKRVIAHGGEAVGFLSVNRVYPAQKAAIVVMTNSWSGDAFSRIADGIAAIALQPAAAANADRPPIDAARVRALYDQLRAGKPDRTLMTANANFYFTPQRVADFESSLGPLGPETSIDAKRPSYLRGGFVIQPFVVRYPDRTLNLSVFAEPGPNGRIEQFLVTPGQ
jgi:CubicO group peptidase (beta-lactamase class C family)